MSETQPEAAPKAAKKAKVKLPTVESRKKRKELRTVARKARRERINKEPEFATAYFAAKKKRSGDRTAAFRKAKSGKK